MAGSRTGRSASRRNTPISPPKQAPAVVLLNNRASKRTTRSQSRDRDATDATRRNRRELSVSSAASQDTGAPTKQRRPHKLGPELSIVPEASEIEESNPRVDQQDAASNEEFYDQESAVSGTSALSSHSAAELRDMDQDLMIETLAPLFNISTTLLKVLLPGEGTDPLLLLSGLNIPDSTASKRLSRTLPRFSQDRSCFGSHEYIDITIATRGLLNVSHVEQIGNGPWRPDNLFRLSNITGLLSTLLPVSRTSPDAARTLRLLNTQFPKSFAPPSKDKRGLDETFAMGMEFRTQLLIRMLMDYEKAPNFDPDKVLKEIFYTDQSGLHFLGWDVDGLHTGNGSLPNRWKQMVSQRIMAIRKGFSTDPRAPVDFDELERSFPWQQFLLDLMRWSRVRCKEITADIASRGGVDEIVFMLQDEIQDRAKESTPVVATASVEQTAPSPEQAQRTSPRYRRSGPFYQSLTPSESGAPDEVASAIEKPGGSGAQGQTAGSQQPAKSAPVPRPEPEPAATSKPTKEYPMLNSPADIKRLAKRMSALKQREAQATNVPLPSKPSLVVTSNVSVPERPVQQETPHTNEAEAQDVEFSPTIDDEFEHEALPPSAVIDSSQMTKFPSSQEMLAALAKHQKESNKENKNPTSNKAQKKPHFIDRQEGAEKMSFDSQDNQRPEPAARKRNRQTHKPAEEEDEDNAFEEDNRNVGRERRVKRPRKSAPSVQASSQSLPPPSNDVQNGREESEARDHPSADEETRRRPGRRPTQARSSTARSSAPRQRDDSSQPGVLDYAYVTQQAKLRKAALTGRPIQKRIRWDEAETGRLVDLVEEYGTSWAALKELDENHPDGPRFEGRDQVQLKEKACNMVVDFIKGDIRLPKNFERVRLKTRQVEELRALGCLDGLRALGYMEDD